MNKTMHISEHFTLGEVTKSSHTEIDNIPSRMANENLSTDVNNPLPVHRRGF